MRDRDEGSPTCKETISGAGGHTIEEEGLGKGRVPAE